MDQDTKDTAPNQPSTASTPPAAPQDTGSAQPSTPSTPPVVVASKPRRRGLVIGIIVAVIALLLAGGAAAYFFWYQNPEKVVTDGLMNAIGSKSSTFKGQFSLGEQLKVDLDGRSNATSAMISGKATLKQNNRDKTLTGDIMVDNLDATYVKVGGVGELLSEYRTAPGVNPEFQAQLDALIAKVNDKWIKLTDKAGDREVKERRCVGETIKKMQIDDQMVSEVVGLYKKHKFIKIDKELGSKDGSLGYSLKFNDAASNEMTKDFKETKMYKDIKACAPEFEMSESDVSPTKNTAEDKLHTEIWVSQWGHQITKLSVHDMSSADGFKMTIEPTFSNAAEEVKAPQNFIQMEEVEAELEALQMMLMFGGGASNGMMQ